MNQVETKKFEVVKLSANAVVVPEKVDQIYVTCEDIEGKVMVVCSQSGDELHTQYFDDVKEAWEVAQLIASEAGLVPAAVDGDVWPVPTHEELTKEIRNLKSFLASIDEERNYEEYVKQYCS